MPKGGRVQVWTEVDATDDYDGKPVSEEDAQEVTFTYDGKRYDLYLRSKNADKFAEVIGEWTKNVEGKAALNFRPGGATGPGIGPDERKALMAWSREQDGMKAVAERGRVAEATLKAWADAGKPGFAPAS